METALRYNPFVKAENVAGISPKTEEKAEVFRMQDPASPALLKAQAQANQYEYESEFCT